MTRSARTQLLARAFAQLEDVDTEVEKLTDKEWREQQWKKAERLARKRLEEA